MKTLKDINKVANQYREIKKFVAMYCSCVNENYQNLLDTEVDPLSAGFYLQAFGNGISRAVESYEQSITELEKKFLRKPTTSLMFIFHEIEKVRPLLDFLLRLINGVKTQRLYGCQILQFLQEHTLHGDKNITRAVYTLVEP